MILFPLQVLLLSTPCLDDFYSLCCNLSKDSQTLKEAVVHPTTLLKVKTLRSLSTMNVCLKELNVKFFINNMKLMIILRKSFFKLWYTILNVLVMFIS